MTTLREARKKGDLEKFIKEHEGDPEGDLDKLDEALKRPASGKPKVTPAASKPENGDD